MSEKDWEIVSFHVMCYKMQGNHVVCNELLSGIVGWLGCRTGLRRVLESFEVRIPKVLPFSSSSSEFLSFSYFLGLGLGLRLGLWLWLGLGFKPRRSNRESISQSFSDKVLLSYII